MTNEIKEILDRAKKLKYKCDCCEEIAPGKYMMRNDKQTDNLIEAVYIIDKLLDYITNLQTIEQQYSAILSENAELENKLTNLQEENKIQKEKIEHLLIDLRGESEYKSRNEKAIEYIKGYESIRAYYEYQDGEYWEFNYDDDFQKELLNILQGEDKDE